MRDMVFVSHANPEDNDFARWLALQVAALGYPVWCDLTKLLGGEVFWSDVQSAIRERTAKFVFVLSRHSNSKVGPLNELELATKVLRQNGLKDFIIPVWIDDVPTTEFDIRIGAINAIRFQEGWARGLDQLLNKLEEDDVPKNTSSFNPGSVSSWWRQHMSAEFGIKAEPETLLTNWFPILPATLYFHELSRKGTGPLEAPSRLPFPAVSHNQYLVSFAPASAFESALSSHTHIAASVARIIGGSGPSSEARLWTVGEERSGVSNLLRQAWLALLETRSLPKHNFANHGTAFYFTKEMVADSPVSFVSSNGTRCRRAMIGYKTLRRPGQDIPNLRHWHFALQAKPSTTPFVGFMMKPHVLFSDDGRTIWSSAKALHRARRSQGRGWWNDRWRDLILGATAWLATDGDIIRLPVGPEQSLEVSRHPLCLISPVSYVEPGEQPEEEFLFEYTEEDDESEDIGDLHEEGNERSSAEVAK